MDTTNLNEWEDEWEEENKYTCFLPLPKEYRKCKDLNEYAIQVYGIPFESLLQNEIEALSVSWKTGKDEYFLFE